MTAFIYMWVGIGQYNSPKLSLALYNTQKKKLQKILIYEIMHFVKVDSRYAHTSSESL